MKIALIEPYYGGSHKVFWDALVQILPYEFQFFTLPARKWKWRMRLAAPFFAEQIRLNPSIMAEVSCFLCSPFLDVAAFKGLLPIQFRDVPVFTYFHENQFAYPVQVEDERDVHFALTNLTTALASDKIAFNSQYNLDSFLAGAETLLGKIYDMKLSDWRDVIEAKSQVLYPGLDFAELDMIQPPEKGAAPVILWNHRWEYDKNPELFFQALSELNENGQDFKLVVLGEAFQQVPEIFARAKEQFKEKTIQFGYVESRREYLSLLKQGDIVVSTANHEFYGIAIIEAVRAGCRPLMPEKLSYPELFPEHFFYKTGELAGELADLLTGTNFSGEKGRSLTEHFSWKTLLPAYQKWFEG